MISNECNGCEYKCSLSHIAICTLGSPCPNQRSTPMTEQEYLQTCTTEQLAEYLASTFDLCGAGCHHCFLANVCLTKAKNGNCLTQEQMIVEWLKQPHTPKE